MRRRRARAVNPNRFRVRTNQRDGDIEVRNKNGGIAIKIAGARITRRAATAGPVSLFRSLRTTAMRRSGQTAETERAFWASLICINSLIKITVIVRRG